MNFTNILLWPILVVGAAGARLLAFATGQINQIRIELFRALRLTAVGTVLGLLIMWSGYLFGGDWIIGLGKLVALIFAATAAYFYAVITVRLTIIKAAADAAATTTTGALRAASQLAPGGPFDIPDLFIIKEKDEHGHDLEKRLTTEILDLAGAGFAALIFVSVYIGFVPVYKNPPAFLAALVAGTFVVFATHFWHIPDRWRIREKLVTAVGLALILQTIVFFLPSRFINYLEFKQGQVLDQLDRNKALEQADGQARKEGQGREIEVLKNLYVERDALLAKYARNRNLSDADLDRLDDLKMQIAEVKSGTLSDSPSTLLASSLFPNKYLAAMTAFVLLIAVYLATRH